MLVKDLITNCDYEKVWENMYNDFFKGKNYTDEKIAYFKDAIKLAIDEMRTIDAKPQPEWLIVVSESYDDLTPNSKDKFMESYLYKTEDIKSLGVDSVVENGINVSDWNEDKLKEYFRNKPFIQSWGYEFSEWKDTLSMYVWDGSLEENTKEKCAGVILFELTYCGFSQEQVNERVNEIFSRDTEGKAHSLEELEEVFDGELDDEKIDIKIEEDLSESLKISYLNWVIMYDRLKKIQKELTLED